MQQQRLEPPCKYPCTYCTSAPLEEEQTLPNQNIILIYSIDKEVSIEETRTDESKRLWNELMNQRPHNSGDKRGCWT